MKKLIALLLALVMVIGLAACGGSATTETKAPAATEAPTQAEAPAETEAAGNTTDLPRDETLYFAGQQWGTVNSWNVIGTNQNNAMALAAGAGYRTTMFETLYMWNVMTGELIGLTWDAIDWEKRTLTVNKTLEFRYKQDEWRAGPPKTESSYRTIPLTDTAYDILREIYATRKYRKESEALSTVLTFMDRKKDKKQQMVMHDLVFINWRTGMPAKNSSYDTHLYKLCDDAGIKRFCMHTLRHTYATRAIECGMQPKVLQKLLGHASITTTMNRYVHVTDDSMKKAVAQFAKAQEAQKG